MYYLPLNLQPGPAHTPPELGCSWLLKEIHCVSGVSACRKMLSCISRQFAFLWLPCFRLGSALWKCLGLIFSPSHQETPQQFGYGSYQPLVFSLPGWTSSVMSNIPHKTVSSPLTILGGTRVNYPPKIWCLKINTTGIFKEIFNFFLKKGRK